MYSQVDKVSLKESGQHFATKQDHVNMRSHNRSVTDKIHLKKNNLKERK